MSRAVGGAGLVITEAAAVTPEGRISPADSASGRMRRSPAMPEAGRRDRRRWARCRASSSPMPAARPAARRPGRAAAAPAERGWVPVAPRGRGLRRLRHPARDERGGDRRPPSPPSPPRRSAASQAGYRVIELHAAHGYLLPPVPLAAVQPAATMPGAATSMAAPRFCSRVVRAVRAAIPDEMPLWVRISADRLGRGRLDDRGDGGAVPPAEGAGRGPDRRLLRRAAPGAEDPARPGLPGAGRGGGEVRRRVAVAAVGLITEPAQAAGDPDRGQGRPDPAGPRPAARSVLADPRRRGARPDRGAAGAAAIRAGLERPLGR